MEGRIRLIDDRDQCASRARRIARRRAWLWATLIATVVVVFSYGATTLVTP